MSSHLIPNSLNFCPSTVVPEPVAKKPKLQNLTPKKPRKSEHFVASITDVGKVYEVGKEGISFYSKRNLKVIENKDYTLIIDGEFDLKYNVEEIKPLLEKRWIYSLHLANGMSPVVNQQTLRHKNEVGKILAYKYLAECSVNGREAVYYGFVPSINPKQTLDGSHKLCRIAGTNVWPRKLYVYIKQDDGMSCCTTECSKWVCRLSDYNTVARFCMQKIPWHDLYIMMGDSDETCVEMVKEPRACDNCAQCYECASIPSGWCSKHKKCKHKKAIVKLSGESLVALVTAKMKSCARYKQGSI